MFHNVDAGYCYLVKRNRVFYVVYFTKYDKWKTIFDVQFIK